MVKGAWPCHDTYGSDDSDIDEDEIKPKRQKKRTTGGQCRCGSTTHKCTNHSDCPLNVKNQRCNVSVDDRASENKDVIILKIPRQIRKVFL